MRAAGRPTATRAEHLAMPHNLVLAPPSQSTLKGLLSVHDRTDVADRVTGTFVLQTLRVQVVLIQDGRATSLVMSGVPHIDDRTERDVGWEYTRDGTCDRKDRSKTCYAHHWSAKNPHVALNDVWGGRRTAAAACVGTCTSAESITASQILPEVGLGLSPLSDTKSRDAVEAHEAFNHVAASGPHDPRSYDKHTLERARKRGSRRLRSRQLATKKRLPSMFDLDENCGRARRSQTISRLAHVVKRDLPSFVGVQLAKLSVQEVLVACSGRVGDGRNRLRCTRDQKRTLNLYIAYRAKKKNRLMIALARNGSTR